MLSALTYSLLLSGLVRNTRALRDTLRVSLSLVFADGPVVPEFFMGQISAESRALPGRSTLYRHRVTLHLAYCLQQQHALA
eukprot:3429083-Alexandrium_andersonii.AAC.1